VAAVKIVVVGAGEVGYHFAERLSRENKEVVVIDINAQPLQYILEHLDGQTLHGSGSNPRIL
jgi:trk system potassium uptake protein